MRLNLLVLLALAAIVLGPLPARALSASPAAPVPGLRAGDVITTAIPALPHGTREFELVLLPEGSAPIVVSPELPAGVMAVSWRMPRTYATRARLVLRLGGAGSETYATPSGWFALGPVDPAAALELRAGRGTDDVAFDVGAVSVAGWRDTSRDETLASGAGAPAAVEAPPAPALASAPPEVPGSASPLGRYAPSRASRLATTSPLRVPLRR